MNYLEKFNKNITMTNYKNLDEKSKEFIKKYHFNINSLFKS